MKKVKVSGPIRFPSYSPVFWKHLEKYWKEQYSLPYRKKERVSRYDPSVSFVSLECGHVGHASVYGQNKCLCVGVSPDEFIKAWEEGVGSLCDPVRSCGWEDRMKRSEEEYGG